MDYIKVDTILDFAPSTTNERREFKGVTYLLIQNAGDYPARIKNWTIYPGASVWFGSELSYNNEDHYLEVEFLPDPVQLADPSKAQRRLEYLVRVRSKCSCSRCQPNMPGPKVPVCELCKNR